jgi:hypothetical protein
MFSLCSVKLIGAARRLLLGAIFQQDGFRCQQIEPTKTAIRERL